MSSNNWEILAKTLPSPRDQENPLKPGDNRNDIYASGLIDIKLVIEKPIEPSK